MLVYRGNFRDETHSKVVALSLIWDECWNKHILQFQSPLNFGQPFARHVFGHVYWHRNILSVSMFELDFLLLTSSRAAGHNITIYHSIQISLPLTRLIQKYKIFCYTYKHTHTYTCARWSRTNELFKSTNN